jgi:uncharacterized protein YneF (UPF0154 family)
MKHILIVPVSVMVAMAGGFFIIKRPEKKEQKGT